MAGTINGNGNANSNGNVNSNNNNNFKRQVAKRIFAYELGATSLSFKDGDDQYSPTYAITPTAAAVNRLFMVATLLEKENIGNESEYWRGRVADPTGSLNVYAGQYQPEAAQFLSDAQVPSLVAIIGKPHTYKTDDGQIKTSIRPEKIFAVDEETQNQWIMETAEATLSRLKAIDSDDPSALQAREHYELHAETYNTMIHAALKTIKL